MSLRGFFNDLLLGGTCRVRTGSASPEGAETAGIGSVYLRTTAGAGTVFYVKESGSGNTGWVAMASASSNSGNLKRGTPVTFTDAQIKTLPTTTPTVLAAGGSGIMRLPTHFIVRANFAAGAYTNISAESYLRMKYGGVADGTEYIINSAITTPVMTSLSTLLSANNWVTRLREISLQPEPISEEWGPSPLLAAIGNLDNAAWTLVVTNPAGNFTGGNAANTLTVIPYYHEEAVA